MIIFSILAFIALLISVCIKERQKSLSIQSLNCLFEAIYAYTIGAFTGALLGLINFIRTFIFIRSKNINKFVYFILLILFEAIIIANCAYTWVGIISILPTIGSIIRTYCLWQSNMKLVRISGMTTGLFYGAYYIFYQSWFIVAGYGLLLIISLINIYKFDLKHHK